MTDPNKKNESDFRKWVHLFFSSSFSRQVKVCLMGQTPKEWVFSTLPCENLYSKFTIEDTVHHMVFKNDKVLKLYKHYPELYEELWQLTPRDLASFFNAFKKYDLPIAWKDGIELALVTFIDKEDAGKKQFRKYLTEFYTKDVPENKTPVTTTVGKIAYAYDYQRYQETLEDILALPKLTTFQLDPSQIERSGSSIVELKNDDLASKGVGVIKLPLQDGVTNVSINIFAKHAKQDFTLHADVYIEKRTLFCVVVFENEDVQVTSIRPQMKWFF